MSPNPQKARTRFIETFIKKAARVPSCDYDYDVRKYAPQGRAVENTPLGRDLSNVRSREEVPIVSVHRLTFFFYFDHPRHLATKHKVSGSGFFFSNEVREATEETKSQLDVPMPTEDQSALLARADARITEDARARVAFAASSDARKARRVEANQDLLKNAQSYREANQAATEAATDDLLESARSHREANQAATDDLLESARSHREANQAATEAATDDLLESARGHREANQAATDDLLESARSHREANQAATEAATDDLLENAQSYREANQAATDDLLESARSHGEANQAATDGLLESAQSRREVHRAATDGLLESAECNTQAHRDATRNAVEASQARQIADRALANSNLLASNQRQSERIRERHRRDELSRDLQREQARKDELLSRTEPTARDMLKLFWHENDRFLLLNEERAAKVAKAAQAAVDAVVDSSRADADSEERDKANANALSSIVQAPIPLDDSSVADDTNNSGGTARDDSREPKPAWHNFMPRWLHKCHRVHPNAPDLQLDLSANVRADRVSDRIEDDLSFNECASCGAFCPNRHLKSLSEVREDYDVSPLRHRLTKFQDALIQRLQWTRVDHPADTVVQMDEDNDAASDAGSSLTSSSASGMSMSSSNLSMSSNVVGDFDDSANRIGDLQHRSRLRASFNHHSGFLRRLRRERRTPCSEPHLHEDQKCQCYEGLGDDGFRLHCPSVCVDCVRYFRPIGSDAPRLGVSCARRVPTIRLYNEVADDASQDSTSGEAADARSLDKLGFPPLAYANFVWPGNVPDQLRDLTRTEKNMLAILCPIVQYAVVRGQNYHLRKRQYTTFTLVRRIVEQAKTLPRMPGLDDGAVLISHKDSTPTEFTYRPKRLLEAMDWLATFNFEYRDKFIYREVCPTTDFPDSIEPHAEMYVLPLEGDELDRALANAAVQDAAERLHTSLPFPCFHDDDVDRAAANAAARQAATTLGTNLPFASHLTEEIIDQEHRPRPTLRVELDSGETATSGPRIELDATETEAVNRVLEQNQAENVATNPGAPGETDANILLHQETSDFTDLNATYPGLASQLARPLTAQEKNTRLVLTPTQATSAMVQPHLVPNFTSLAFPTLLCFAVGGPNHALYPYASDCAKRAPFELLHPEGYARHVLMRGHDFRFEKEPSWYFTVYTHLMMRRVGGIAASAAHDDTPAISNANTTTADTTGSAGADPSISAPSSSTTNTTTTGAIPSEAQLNAAVLAAATNDFSNIDSVTKTLMVRFVPFARNLPGSPAHKKYYQNVMYSMLVNPYVNDVGTWRWFITFAQGDLTNRRFFEHVALPCGTSKAEAVAHVTANLQQSKHRLLLLRDHPATASRWFDIKQQIIWDEILGNPADKIPRQGLLGVITDVLQAREEQGRGSEHDHIVIAVKHDGITAADFATKEGKQKITDIVANVVTAKLEPRPPGDTTFLEGFFSPQDQRQQRFREIHPTEKLKWRVSPKDYFGSNLDEHPGSLPFERPSTRFQYARYTAIFLNGIINQKRKLDADFAVAQAKAAETYELLNEAQDPYCLPCAPSRAARDEIDAIYAGLLRDANARFASEIALETETQSIPSAAVNDRRIRMLTNCLISYATAQRYRNLQIAVQQHFCTGTCWKYNRKHDKTCRFYMPRLLEYLSDKGCVASFWDRKSRRRLNVHPPCDNVNLNSTWLDAVLFLFHRGNADVQFVDNDRGAVTYTCAYISKHDKPDCELVRKILVKKFASLLARNDLTDRNRLKAVGNAVLSTSEVSANHVCRTLLKIKNVRVSRNHVNINALPRSQVSRVVATAHQKSKVDLQESHQPLPSESVDPTTADVHDGTFRDNTVNTIEIDDEPDSLERPPSTLVDHVEARQPPDVDMTDLTDDAEAIQHDVDTTSANNSQSAESSPPTYSIDSQFGRREVYRRVCTHNARIYEGDARFRRDRDEAATFFTLHSWYNISTTKPTHESDETDGTPCKKRRKCVDILDEPVCVDARGLPARAWQNDATDTEPHSQFRIVDPDGKQHDLIFRLRRRPKCLNLSPYIPFDANKERSTYAFLLLHTEWPIYDPAGCPLKIHDIGENYLAFGCKTTIERFAFLSTPNETTTTNNDDQTPNADGPPPNEGVDSSPMSVDLECASIESSSNETSSPAFRDDGAAAATAVSAAMRAAIGFNIRIPTYARGVIKAMESQANDLMAMPGLANHNNSTRHEDDDADNDGSNETFFVPSYDELECTDTEYAERLAEAANAVDATKSSLVGNLSLQDYATFANCIDKWSQANNAESCVATSTADIIKVQNSEVADIFEDTQAQRAKLDADVAKLNVEQRQVYDCIVSALERSDTDDAHQLRLFMSGGGGVGKTFAIHCATLYARLKYGKTLGHFGPVLLMAPTGSAASNLGGYTWQGALNKGFSASDDRLNDTVSSTITSRLQSKLAGVRLVVIDEISMIRAADIWDIHRRLCAAAGVDESDIAANVFGGYNISFAGDYWQLPSFGCSLYEADALKQKPKSSPEAKGYKLWRMVNSYVELVRNNRQQSGDVLGELCTLMRTGTLNDRLLAHLNSRIRYSDDQIRTELAAEGCNKALWLAPTNKACDEINESCFSQLVANGAQHVRVWAQHFASQVTSEPPDAATRRSLLERNNRTIVERRKTTTPTLDDAFLDLAIGSRVALSSNINTQLKLYQGALGTVHHFAYIGNVPSRTARNLNLGQVSELDHPPHIPVVFVQMDDIAIDPTTQKPFTCDPNIPRLVPIVAGTSHTAIQRRYKRHQLPLRIAHCRTFHKAQGLTAHHGVVITPSDITDPRQPYAMALEYVAVSRAKSLNRVWLRGAFHARHVAPAIHQAKRNQVRAEYDRLRSLSDHTIDPLLLTN